MTFFGKTLAAQSSQQQQVDSLREVVAQFESEKKLEEYERLARFYFVKGTMDTVLFQLFDDMDAEALKQENFKYLYKARSGILSALYNRLRFDDIIRLAPGYLDFFRDKREENRTEYFLLYYLLIIACSERDIETAISEAQKMYEQAKMLNNRPGMAIALYAMSSVYSIQLREKENEELLKECIALFEKCDSKGVETLMENAHLRYCSLLIRQNRFGETAKAIAGYEEALRRIDRLLSRKMSRENLWELYVIYYIKTGEYDKAESYCAQKDSVTQTPVWQLNSAIYRLKIFGGRGQYDKALEMADKAMNLIRIDNKVKRLEIQSLKMDILSQRDGGEISKLAASIIALKDSIHHEDLARQIDELRTQYEVDKHERETKYMRKYIYVASAVCALLVITLLIWIHYSRVVSGKNRGLMRKIKEQDALFAELKHKLEQEHPLHASLDPVPETGDSEYVDRDMYFVRLNRLLKEKRLFTDPKISRQSIAATLGLNERALYDCIKSHTGMNFNSYIAWLRMAEARELLANKQLTIEGIALEVGFGSRITFYRLFKENYGLSPDEYRKLSADQKVEILNLAEEEFEDNKSGKGRRG
jgi:AraC-like DNA-binding protein